MIAIENNNYLKVKTTMTIFINLSARKQKVVYVSLVKILTGFNLILIEVINGVIISLEEDRELAKVTAYLTTNNISYREINDNEIEEQKMDFVFQFRITPKGDAIFKKAKTDYLSKYIIYPSLSKFKSLALIDSFCHFPEGLFSVKSISFNFQIAFKSVSFKQRKELKDYIEKKVEENLIKQKLIIV